MSDSETTSRTSPRIAVAGCRGRMGRLIASVVAASDAAQLIGGSVRPGDSAAGRDLGELLGGGPLGAPVSDDPLKLFAEADVVIDFTVPELATKHAELAAQSKVALVVGTSGLDAAAKEALQRAARHTPVVFAPNVALGVTLLNDFVRRAARTLGEDYDIEILEMFHRRKADAPSGTALMLGQSAAEGRGTTLSAVEQRARDGHTGPREAGAIGFAVLRGGDVAGDHSVIFAGEGERVELVHRASSPQVFARGALRAATWAARREAGFYSMRDVLGLGPAED